MTAEPRGLVPPDAGTIHRTAAATDRQGTGVVLQGYGLLPVLTAAENVDFALQVHPRPAADNSASPSPAPRSPDRRCSSPISPTIRSFASTAAPRRQGGRPRP